MDNFKCRIWCQEQIRKLSFTMSSYIMLCIAVRWTRRSSLCRFTRISRRHPQHTSHTAKLFMEGALRYENAGFSSILNGHRYRRVSSTPFYEAIEANKRKKKNLEYKRWFKIEWKLRRTDEVWYWWIQYPRERKRKVLRYANGQRTDVASHSFLNCSCCRRVADSGCGRFVNGIDW